MHHGHHVVRADRNRNVGFIWDVTEQVAAAMVHAVHVRHRVLVVHVVHDVKVTHLIVGGATKTDRVKSNYIILSLFQAKIIEAISYTFMRFYV